MKNKVLVIISLIAMTLFYVGTANADLVSDHERKFTALGEPSGPSLVKPGAVQLTGEESEAPST